MSRSVQYHTRRGEARSDEHRRPVIDYAVLESSTVLIRDQWDDSAANYRLTAKIKASRPTDCLTELVMTEARLYRF